MINLGYKNVVAGYSEGTSSWNIYGALVFISILNGVSYNVFTWSQGYTQWSSSPLLLITLFVIVKGLLRETDYRPHWAVLLLWAGSLLVPSSTFSWFALFLVSLLAICSGTRKALHILTALLAFSEVCDSIVFKVVSSPVLEFEAHLVLFILQMWMPSAYAADNIIFINQDYALSVSSGCSALLSLSVVLLAWASVYFAVNQTLPRLFLVVAVAVAFFGLNTARILVMSIDPTWYTFAHDGYGKQLFDVLVLCLVLLAAFSGGKRCQQ